MGFPYRLSKSVGIAGAFRYWLRASFLAILLVSMSFPILVSNAASASTTTTTTSSTNNTNLLSQISVSVAYADSLRPNASKEFFPPDPWYSQTTNSGSNVLWEGCRGGCSTYDGGAVMVTNGSNSQVDINSLAINFGPDCTYNI